MPRWKLSEQILNYKNNVEFFDESWMNYDSIFDYMPEPVKWKESRQIKFEDVQIWEIISEVSGPIGVYAAWQPYAPYFIVTKKYSIDKEFWGTKGEEDLQKYVVKYGICLPKNTIWVDSEDMYLYENKISQKIIIP